MRDDPPSGSSLPDLSLQRAERELDSGDAEASLTWLSTVPPTQRPKALEARIRYGVAKVALAAGDSIRAERELATAHRLDPQPCYQRRLEGIRRRTPLLETGLWEKLRAKVDPAKRLPPDSLAPALSTVWSCGAYHSRGRGRGMPWTRLLREAKDPPSDEAERAMILKFACGYLCRYILSATTLLRSVDFVVAIPPDIERYAQRGMSLPDKLAAAVDHQLALPWLMEALVKTKSVQLRGLPWPARAEAIRDSMEARDAGALGNRSVLLVDDVTTSGATLREAARVLRSVGARDVHAAVLCHAEG